MQRETALILLCSILSVGCSTGTSPSADGGPAGREDGAVGGDAILWPCKARGLACNAHDTCAINPVCGDDNLCRPQGYQDCDDGLECTSDSCEGLGLCEHEPIEGWCRSPVKTPGGTKLQCFRDGDIHPADPCQICEVKAAADAWSPRNGGYCDDGDPCTMDDYCQLGICKGTHYSCADDLSCTKDSCDGKGGCSHTIAPNECAIDGKCHVKGDTATAGCGTCDPTKSPTQWTPPYNSCFIGDTCATKGQPNSTGCGVCDPASAPNLWTLVNGASAKTDGFESGIGSFTTTPKTGGVGWQVTTLRAHGGTRSLYYGDTTKKTYDTGGNNAGTATSQVISLPASQKAALYFWLYLDVATSSYIDVLTVEVAALSKPKEVWRKNQTTIPGQNYRRWVLVQIDLREFADSKVKISFKFETKYKVFGSYEGVFIDDISVVTGCGSLPKASPFVMDGELDASAKKVGGGKTTMPLYMAFNSEHLYVATHDAGEGNDNFLLLSSSAPGAAQSVPWGKAGKLALGGDPIFAADENDSSYCGLFELGKTAPDKLLASCGKTTSDNRYGVATPLKNGGWLEMTVNIKEVYGVIPKHVYVVAAPYGTSNSGALVHSAQTPSSKNNDGNIDANEILKVSLPTLTIIP